MERLYIAFVDTPGIFASMIRKVVKMNYVHVVLSLDENLFEAYSVGRRNPKIPIFAGFERENLEKIYEQFPKAKYRVTYIECTSEQKHRIKEHLIQCYRERFKYHYCLLGLPFILMKKPFYQKKHYTCSSYISRLLDENGIKLFDKHFSLVTPRDFFDLNFPVLYEGEIFPLVEKYVRAKQGIFQKPFTSQERSE